MKRFPIVLLLAATPLAAQTQVLVVAGLGGEPRYQEAFLSTALAIADAGPSAFGAAPSDVIVLAEDPSRDSRVAARSTRDEVGRRLAGFAGRGPDALLVVVLLGHGSAAGGEPRLNLPGPDLTAADLATMLEPFAARQVIVVNAASASGGWIPILAAPRRALVTATRSATERDESHFGRHFADALKADDADRDKDGRLSLFEVFEYARREVARLYEREQRLQSEHALLDADGDGEGARAPDATAGDGAAAAAILLAGRPGAGSRPGLAGLETTRDSLQREVTALRTRKNALAPAEYERRLEALLLELARVSRDLREREGREP